MSQDSRVAAPTLTESQRTWLQVRTYLKNHRFDLTVAAGGEYPSTPKVDPTPLLVSPPWIPEVPIRLDAISLEYRPKAQFAGISGTEEVSDVVRPLRPDGSRYRNYSEALSELAAPGLFENRATYRLLEADLITAPRLTFGPGRYFDGIDVGEACAHEYAAAALDHLRAKHLRDLVGDPCDPRRRRTNVAISTLTLRHDRGADATFLLHRRDADTVGHAGGLHQVLPVGIFQPAGEEPWNVTNDFSLWHCMIREFAEELLGETEDHGTDKAPIDYTRWPFAVRMTNALRDGHIRAYVLGIGVDPLTFATDILTTVVFDAATFDQMFGQLVSKNSEGSIRSGVPFQHDAIDRLVSDEPLQAAGAALLARAWDHREQLLA